MAFDARPAVPDDFGAIMEIVAFAQDYPRTQGVDQWQNGYPDTGRIGADIAGGIGHVLTLEGRVMCYGVLTFGDEASYAEIYDGSWMSDAPYGTLHRLAAHPDARSTGAAERLVAHLEGLCKQAGYSWLRSDTHRGNAPMRRFMEKRGYHNRGVVYLAGPGVGGSIGDERIVYEKPLT